MIFNKWAIADEAGQLARWPITSVISGLSTRPAVGVCKLAKVGKMQCMLCVINLAHLSSKLPPPAPVDASLICAREPFVGPVRRTRLAP